MNISKRTIILLSISTTAFILFSFVNSNQSKTEYVNIEIDNIHRQRRVVIDFSDGKHEKRIYCIELNKNKRKNYEAKGYQIFVVKRIGSYNSRAMKLLNEFGDLGWELNSHSKTATSWSDETHSGSSQSANYILER